MAAPDISIEPTNVFQLSANFKTSKSTDGLKVNNAQALDEAGNVACQRNTGGQTDLTQEAKYCGSDFVTDLGTILTKFGDVHGAGILTGLTITPALADYVSISLAGHQHAVNPHVAGLTNGYVDVSDFLPHELTEAFKSWDGFGIPDFGIAIGDDAAIASCSIAFSFGAHPDPMDQNGDHLIGKNLTPKCDLNMSFVGIPTSNTRALIEADLAANTNHMFTPLVDSTDASDSNVDYDAFSFVAHANPALATA